MSQNVSNFQTLAILSRQTVSSEEFKYTQNSSIKLDPNMGSCYSLLMRVIAKRTLREFWQRSGQGDSRAPLEAWYAETRRASWQTPQRVKDQFRNASILKNGRVVFNIAGNKYRLIVAIDYQRQVGFIKFIGSHKQYDQIDAEKI